MRQAFLASSPTCPNFLRVLQAASAPLVPLPVVRFVAHAFSGPEAVHSKNRSSVHVQDVPSSQLGQKEIVLPLIRDTTIGEPQPAQVGQCSRSHCRSLRARLAPFVADHFLLSIRRRTSGCCAYHRTTYLIRRRLSRRYIARNCARVSPLNVPRRNRRIPRCSGERFSSSSSWVPCFSCQWIAHAPLESNRLLHCPQWTALSHARGCSVT